MFLVREKSHFGHDLKRLFLVFVFDLNLHKALSLLHHFVLQADLNFIQSLDNVGDLIEGSHQQEQFARNRSDCLGESREEAPVAFRDDDGLVEEQGSLALKLVQIQFSVRLGELHLEHPVSHLAFVQVSDCLLGLFFREELHEGVVLVSEKLNLFNIAEAAEKIQNFPTGTKKAKVIRANHFGALRRAPSQVVSGFCFAQGEAHLLGVFGGNEHEVGGEGASLSDSEVSLNSVLFEKRNLISVIGDEVEELNLAFIGGERLLVPRIVDVDPTQVVINIAVQHTLHC